MKLSVAIPCYEMRGRGAEMLQYSLNILKEQNISFFEVIVSDHSIDDNIEKVCIQESKNLDIKYMRYSKMRGSSSSNMNNAIKNCSGDIIKILCQDDYLFGGNSIAKTIEAFDLNKKWFVSSYFHTYDRVNLIDFQFPRLSNNISLDNQIGTHSCLTILNEDPLLFDEQLIWFMDSEYYYRLYKKFGEPQILLDPTVVQLLWKGQVTNTLINNNLVEKERRYIEKKRRNNEFS
jgi:glycosyltransferase involved in cell wall biosynthesis